MKTYTFDFYICKRNGREHMERIEMERPALTSRDFRWVIDDLVFFAWSVKPPMITAEIQCEGKLVATVRALVETVAPADLIRNVKIQIARPCEVFRTVRTVPVAA